MTNTSKFDIEQKVPICLDLVIHFVLVAALAAFFYRITNGWTWPLLAVIGGIFIDIDHLIDYFAYCGFRFNLREFFSCTYHKTDKCYIIFHSWELLILLWLFSLNVLWIFPLVSGMTLHMVTDAFLTHSVNLRCYSLLYRWRRGFKLDIQEESFSKGGPK